jgi:hypothetical protein
MNANWTAIQATRASPAPKSMSAPSDACRVHKVSLSGPFTRRKGRKAPLSAGPMALPVPAAPDTPKGRFRRLGNRRRQPPPWVLLKSRPAADSESTTQDKPPANRRDRNSTDEIRWSKAGPAIGLVDIGS